MYRLSRRLATAALVAVVLSSGHAFAAPNDSSDRQPIKRVIKFIQQVLHIVPAEDPIPPKP